MKMDFENTIANVNSLLDSNNEWLRRYKGYTEKINENKERYILGRKKFQIKHPFHLYTSIKNINDFKVLNYDLRFLGQSIAKISIKNNEVFIDVNSDKAKKNESFFGVKTVPKVEKWQSYTAKKFRKEFKDCKIQQGRSKEHLYESDLLGEFSKEQRCNKNLCNIQPVNLCGIFFQLTTPLKASSGDIEYSSANGGGIDILARVKHSDNSNRLCVMELKDQNNGSEPPIKVMKQAIAYATFLARLLRSDSGDEWYKILGFSGVVPEKLIIDVSIVMPFKQNSLDDSSLEQKIEVCKDTVLELHTLYFSTYTDNLNKRQYNFQGSLMDHLMP